MRNLAWLYFGSCVCGLLLGVGCWIQKTPTIFLTTMSPNNTYTVKLKSRKAPLQSEVRADVLKRGQAFLYDIRLHSTRDTSDLPFEAGYPEVRWLGENVVEFYRKQYFDKGADLVEIQNQTTKPIKYLHLESVNKVLLFDVQPGVLLSLEVPAPRGDSQWLALEGAFSDGQNIEFNSRGFDRRSFQRDRSVYRILITGAGFSIESQGSIRP